MVFTIIIGLLFLFLIFLFVFGCIKKWDNYGWYLFPIIILGVLLFFNIKFDIWILNKKTFYIKPKIVLLKRTDTTIRYLIDDEQVINKNEILWINTNNIYWKCEYYKSKTNKSLIVRSNK